MSTRQVSAGVLACALLSSLVLGVLVTMSPFVALAVFAASAFVLILLYDPGYLPWSLLAGLLAQPLILRAVPDSFAYWIWIKRADEFVIVALLPFAALRLLSQRRWPLPRGATIGAVVLLAVGVIGGMRRSTPLAVASLDAFLLFKGLSFYLIVSAFCPSLRVLVRGFWFLLSIGVAIGFIGVVEVLSPDLVRTLLPLVTHGYRSGMVCLISIFEGEGQAGWFFAFLAVLSFSLYSVTRRLPSLCLFFFFCACSLLTLRRKPIGGILFMFLVYALIAPKAERRRGVALLLLLVLVVGVGFGDVVVGVFVDGYAQYVGAVDPMRVARNAMYATSFQLAKDHFPIGVGFGLFGGFASRLYYSPVYFEYGLSRIWGLSPDNPRFIMDAFWPHIVGQFGTLGFAAFAAILTSIWLPIFRRVRLSGNSAVSVLVLAAALSFAEAMVESTAESIFEATLPSFLLFGLAAVAHAHLGRKPASRPSESSSCVGGA